MMDPQVSPDLARKVLAADLRNAIKEVSDGSKLAAPHRKTMEGIALTPEMAAQQRALSLLQKYCDGHELKPSQWEEVRATHPGFATVHPPVEQPPVLEPEESKAEWKPKLTKADETLYQEIYKKNWRTIRCWITRGEENGDPCPLNDPVKMLDWWGRNMKWRVPAEIEAAAVSASKALPAEPEIEQPREPTLPVASDPAGPPAVPPLPSGQKIDIREFDPEEGDRLHELKQLQVAKFSQLREALLAGNDATSLETKYFRLTETIDKIESRAVERMRKRGQFLLRVDVERELAGAAELLRQSRDAMTRRVLESCSSLSAEQRIEVATAIDRARATEERMLCRLDTLSTTDLMHEMRA